jgi:hypothetical protein
MKTISTDVWETNEIVYVAALKCHGYDEREMVFDDSANSVFWIYEKTSELMECVKGIVAGEVLVEPRQFNSFFTGTKDAMFDFMRSENVRPARRGN